MIPRKQVVCTTSSLFRIRYNDSTITTNYYHKRQLVILLLLVVLWIQVIFVQLVSVDAYSIIDYTTKRTSSTLLLPCSRKTVVTSVSSFLQLVVVGVDTNNNIIDVRKRKSTALSVTLSSQQQQEQNNNNNNNKFSILLQKVKCMIYTKRIQHFFQKNQKLLKLLFFGSFLLDACIILFSGRQALKLLLLSSSQQSQPSSSLSKLQSISTIIQTMISSIWFHIYHRILFPLYQLRTSILVPITVFVVVVVVPLMYILYDIQQTQQRQKIDITCEWERYAKYPIARMITITQIVITQMIPLSMQIILYQQLLKIINKKNMNRTLYYTTKIHQLKETMGYTFANGLLQLGPLYIKLGQIISCRDNVLPKEWDVAMEQLQDQVPAQTGDKAQQLAYTIWPGGKESFDNIFCNVNWTPIAAASLGQVHTATLRSNTKERLAIKFQRPNLRTIYNNDLHLLMKIANIVDQFFIQSAGSVGGIQQSWTTIFTDAQTILYREIDYIAEAQNSIRFSTDFGITKGGEPLLVPSSLSSSSVAIATSRDGQPLPSAASWLRTPYIYESLCTEQVLVMEYVPSIKISNIDQLTKMNVTIADRIYLADCLGRSYLRQFCCNKFFSTDPHAGNLGVELMNMESTKPEERVRLVYYDFGQATELQSNQADGILDIVEAIIDMDVDKSIESFQKMGVLKDNANLTVVREKVADNYRTGKVKANRKKLLQNNYQFKASLFDDEYNTNNVTKTTTTTSASDAQVMQYFTLPAEYAFVGRALSQMDGVGKVLDPEFDFISASAPYIVEIKGTKKYIQDEIFKWFTNICTKIGNIFSK